MSAALSASWSIARPYVNATPADLDWGRVLADRLAPWPDRVRLWELGGDTVAYAWLSPPSELDWHQRADLPGLARERIVADAVDWASAGARAAASPGAADVPDQLAVWAVDADTGLVRVLEHLGFAAAQQPGLTHWYRHLVDAPPLPDPALPSGYRLRTVRWPDDIADRVDVHRAAFAPSKMTVEKYERLANMPHYAPARDVVVEAPDGSLAAFAIAWLDPIGGIGELEPVGTHPAHRRRGLARAVTLAALAMLRAVGAQDVLVFSRPTNGASEALYAAVGFEAITASRTWTRPITEPVAPGTVARP